MAGVSVSFLASQIFAAEWRIVDISGPVRVAIPGSAPSAGRQNQTVPTGTSVTTAGGGRATLDNGEQRIVVGPNSRLTVQPDAGGFKRIAQDLGAAMFKVDKKAAPHFRVETPLLAAIVKGTTFTVMVEGASDAVSVAEGLVEVRSNLNAIGSDVAAGATGTVMRDSPSAVQVVTPAAAPAGPAPAPVNIAPIDYKAASDGLIDIAPTVAQAGQDRAVIRAASVEPSNNAVGASVQDSATIATGGSIGAAVAQVASFEAAQRETAAQVAVATAPINGNGGLGLGVSGNGNGNNGNGNGNGGSTAVVDASNGNSGNGPAGNGNSGAAAANGNGAGNNGNGNGNGGGAALADAGSGNSGNGNSGNGNGNSGNGNNGNGNSGSNAVADLLGGLGGGNSGNGNSGNGNSGNSGNGRGNSGG